MTLQETERVASQDAECSFAFFLLQSTVATSVTLAVPPLSLLDSKWPSGATASSTSWYLNVGDGVGRPRGLKAADFQVGTSEVTVKVTRDKPLAIIRVKASTAAAPFTFIQQLVNSSRGEGSGGGLEDKLKAVKLPAQDPLWVGLEPRSDSELGASNTSCRSMK